MKEKYMKDKNIECEYCNDKDKEFDYIKDVGKCSIGISGKELWFQCMNDEYTNTRYEYYGSGNIKINYCPMCGKKL